MTKADLVTFIAEEAGIKKTEAEKALGAFLSAVEKTLKKGDKMALTGFGTFSVSERKARTGACLSMPKRAKSWPIACWSS